MQLPVPEGRQWFQNGGSVRRCFVASSRDRLCPLQCSLLNRLSPVLVQLDVKNLPIWAVTGDIQIFEMLDEDEDEPL